MTRVRVSGYFDVPLLRQTPGGTGIWKDCLFGYNDPEFNECDYWVVYGDVARQETVHCPPENTLFISVEPPELRLYPDAFCSQFERIVTCQKRIRHPNVLVTQQSLPWHVGLSWTTRDNSAKGTMVYDDFRENLPAKQKVLSVISSNKTNTKGHAARLRFVEKLAAKLGNDIDVFGRGIREVNDKWEAIAPYKYHIAIENSRVEDYWTEKLSDSYLGGAFPIYHGCPNIADYFSPAVMTVIDIADFPKTLDAIQKTIAEDKFSKAQAAMLQARDLVLDTYNLFPFLADFISKTQHAGIRRPITIDPISAFESNTSLLLRRLGSLLPSSVRRLAKHSFQR